MIRDFRRPWRHRASCALMFLASVAACKESMPGPPRATLAAAKAVEAGLMVSTLSPEAGDTVVVAVRFHAGVEVRPAASFTVRVTYDDARLAFDAEVPGDGAGARVVNGAIPGDVRAAGIATDGFTDGTLVAFRFIAKSAGPLGTLRLSVDELHATDNEDLARVVIRATEIEPGMAR